jgi:hypothetical protein
MKNLGKSEQALPPDTLKRRVVAIFFVAKYSDLRGASKYIRQSTQFNTPLRLDGFSIVFSVVV